MVYLLFDRRLRACLHCYGMNNSGSLPIKIRSPERDRSTQAPWGGRLGFAPAPSAYTLRYRSRRAGPLSGERDSATAEIDGRSVREFADKEEDREQAAFYNDAEDLEKDALSSPLSAGSLGPLRRRGDRCMARDSQRPIISRERKLPR
jgi:hypothetical protein